jgi:hypothetical protein
MKASFLPLVFTVLLFSCSANNKNAQNDLANSLIGTWQLISETKIVKTDTTFSESGKDSRMIKIINPTHFAFLKHDLKKGADSVKIFVAGGGAYTLKDNQYTENLEYCNFREWENNTFEFSISINNDTLVQQGREKVEGVGVDRIIIEKYVRTKE